MTYSVVALAGAVVAYLVFSGTWDTSGSGLFGPPLHVAGPVGVIAGVYAVVREFRHER